MGNLDVLKDKLTMTSLAVCDLINKFRQCEGNNTVKEHKTLMRDIRNEIEILEMNQIKAEYNFVPWHYLDKNNQKRPCYQITKVGVMLLLNKESTLVRYKTQLYIEELENKFNQQPKTITDNSTDQLNKKIDLLITKNEELAKLVLNKTKSKFNYGKLIKDHLGTSKVDEDYKTIKRAFLFEMGVNTWSEVEDNKHNIDTLKQICTIYSSRKNK